MTVRLRRSGNSTGIVFCNHIGTPLWQYGSNKDEPEIDIHFDPTSRIVLVKPGSAVKLKRESMSIHRCSFSYARDIMKYIPEDKALHPLFKTTLYDSQPAVAIKLGSTIYDIPPIPTFRPIITLMDWNEMKEVPLKQVITVG